MAARIYPKRPPKLFIAEWRDKFGFTQAELGLRLGSEGVSDVTVSRWETGERRPDIDTLAATAEALGHNLEARDLYRHPDQPSADDLLRGQPPDVVDNAMRMIAAIRR